MQKKIFLFILFLFLSVSLLFFAACEKKSTNSNNGNGTSFSLLVGTWNSQSATVDIKFVTNSAQNAIDLLSEATGNISVSGDHSAQLTYLLSVPFGQIIACVITNVSMLQYLMQPSYPYHLLQLSMTPFANIVTYTAVETENDSTVHIGDFGDFTYNADTYGVTADNADFYSDDLSSAVIVDGSLTPQTISISANSPTSILPMPIPLPAEDIGVLILNSDSTFTAQFTIDIDFIDVDTTITGRWNADSEQLMLYNVDSEGGDTTTITMDYTLLGNSLGLTAELKLSEVLEEVDTEGLDVEQLLEAFFALDAGSLEDVIVDISITMSKGSAKMYFDKSNKSKWFNDSYRRKKILKLLHNMDSMLKN